MSQEIIAYIGLGSNLNQPVQQLTSALNALHISKNIKLMSASRFYTSPPMGPQDQPDYVNAAAKISTSLGAHQLLELCQSIENTHGRIRTNQRWGARSLDMDILTYGQLEHCEPALTLPHPGIAERGFVLYPLLELDENLRIPGLDSIQTMINHLIDSKPVLLDP